MSEGDSKQVTELLQDWARGDQNALHALIPAVHRELRLVAHYHLKSQRPDHTLQSTALVNEAFVRLLGSQPAALRDRSHFMALASRLMRQILVDYARNHRAKKRSGGIRLGVEELSDVPAGQDLDLVALNDALTDLAQLDERQSKIVEMKFFGGMSGPEIAKVLNVSAKTVDRDWATARIWLYGHLRGPSLR